MVTDDGRVKPQWGNDSTVVKIGDNEIVVDMFTIVLFSVYFRILITIFLELLGVPRHLV